MRLLVLPLTLLAVAAPGVAATHQSTDVAGAKALDPVLACRAIGDAAQRLACYDRSVEALQAAAAKRDIVVVDRAEVRKARRSLFGFTLPSLLIFGDPDDDAGARTARAAEEEVREINATVRSARIDGMGNWVVVLDDGAVWHQTEGEIARSPRPGDAIVIRRAALGSYFMRVGKQPGVKARRES